MPEIVKISQITPDSDNANKGTERGAYMVAESLDRYGAGRSILLDKNGRVIAGNKTLQGYAEQGNEDVIVVKTDGKKLVAVQREDLDLETDAAAKELAVADNRASEVGLAWDVDVLAQLDADADVDLSDFFFENEWDALIALADAEVLLPPEETDAKHLENPYAERAEARQEAEAAGEATPTRFVQLILSEAQYEPFMAALKKMGAKHGTTSITETVYRTVMDAANPA